MWHLDVRPVLGLGLWAAVGRHGSPSEWSLLLLVRCRGYLAFCTAHQPDRVSVGVPTFGGMQWRLAVSSIVGCFRVQFADPSISELGAGGGWPNGDDLAAGSIAAGNSTNMGSGAAGSPLSAGLWPGRIIANWIGSSSD